MVVVFLAETRYGVGGIDGEIQFEGVENFLWERLESLLGQEEEWL